MKSNADPLIVLPELLQEQVGEWTVLLVWASWSARGRRLKQELETAVRPPEVKVLDLRVENATPIVTALAIPSVPDLALLYAGTEVARPPANVPLPDLLDWVQEQWSG